jgi:hypothetical protein
MSREQEAEEEREADEQPEMAQTRREVLVWNDFVHEQEDNAQLSLWRLGFTPNYMYDEIFEALHRVFETKDIRAHVAYETLGDYDLLLRLWIPESFRPEDIELELRRELQHCNLLGLEYFACHTISHHANSDERRPDPGKVTAALELVHSLEAEHVREIAEYNKQQAATTKLIDRVYYEQLKWEDLPQIPRPPKADELLAVGALMSVPLTTRGIRCFVTFDAPRRSFYADMKRLLLLSLDAKCLEVRLAWQERMPHLDPPQVSIYAGKSPSTSDFIVMARAPHGCFHGFVHDLVMGVRDVELIKALELRPYTHVIADRMFTEFQEERREPDGPGPVDESTVQRDEDESLEFKATLYENFRSYIDHHRHERSEGRLDDVIKAVCGLLNAPQPGRLVIGVLEVRREIGSRDDPVAYLDRLRRDFDYDYDPEDLSNPPQAVVGIEIEIGPEGFSDADEYRNFLRDKLLTNIKPPPFPYTRIDFPTVLGRQLCVVSTRPGDVWFEARVGKAKKWDFFVREGASTRPYDGQDRLLYQAAHPRRG